MHQLNPKLNKEKWSIEDNKLLFNLHKTYKSHWKKIAEHFHGRTDNSIKNQFFSVVRKALRKACKVLGNVSNTNTINKIKPKVLSNYLSLDYDLALKGEERVNVKVCFNEFVQQFAFSKYHELAKNLKENDLIIIRSCIEYLNNLNEGYVKKKKKISKKSSRKSNNGSLKRTEPDQNLFLEHKIRSSPKVKELHAEYMATVKPLVEAKTPNKEKLEETEQIIRKFEELFRSNTKLEISQENAKDRLINFFGNLGELSYKVKSLLVSSSEDSKDSLMLSNFFSVASKTRKFFDIEENEPEVKDKNNFGKSNDEENLKKLAQIFVLPETHLSHQVNQAPSFNFNFINSSESNRHLEQFNRFFQKESHNDEGNGFLTAPSLDFGISERLHASKQLSGVDNRSHVEAVFNDYGFASLTNSKFLKESHGPGLRNLGRLFKSKTECYTEKDIDNFENI